MQPFFLTGVNVMKDKGNRVKSYGDRTLMIVMMLYFVLFGHNIIAEEHSDMTLIDAVKKQDTDTFKQLINKTGIEIDASDAEGNTALIWAVKYGYEWALKLLLEKGANPNIITQKKASPLGIACFKMDKASVETLLSYGADPSQKGFKGWTPLMRASGMSEKDILSTLINHGAAINVVNDDGQTALMIAVTHNRPENVSLLLDYGADVSVKDNFKKDAFEYAQEKQNSEILSLLKKEITDK